MTSLRRQRSHPNRKSEYEALIDEESRGAKIERKPWVRQHPRLLLTWILAAGVIFYMNLTPVFWPPRRLCDRVDKGYICQPEISHYWGQYSPYFSAPSDFALETPAQCNVTFAKVLSRHGARWPTPRRTLAYNATIQKIHETVQEYPGRYSFLETYQYVLGADDLTQFGEQQMINSGVKFFKRYRELAENNPIFVRSAGQERVVRSAELFMHGYDEALGAIESTRPESSDVAKYPLLVIPEDAGSNNTLGHNLCTNFRHGPNGDIAYDAQRAWARTFIPSIQTRLNDDLQGANLTAYDVINLMEMCPFDTVAAASHNGSPSPFCNLFDEIEWHQYNYYETLNKFYGYSEGNPLASTQGTGWVNELIARLTNQPVQDETSTNRTLDEDPRTFPLGLSLYADFSHDNDIAAIFAALGLYNGTAPFPHSTIVEAEDANGFSASWTVPFAARAYFERLSCLHHDEELVRVIVNDRVIPLSQCAGDELGRCTLSAFIDSLDFAASGGNWDDCFSDHPEEG